MAKVLGQPATLAEQIARTVAARLNCIKAGNRDWLSKHGDTIAALAAELPSGSGIDAGTSIDLDRSTGETLVLLTAYHHMGEHGFYTRWTEHAIKVRASLISGLQVSISGPNYGEIKEYLAELFDYALSRRYVLTYEPETDTHGIEACEESVPPTIHVGPQVQA